MRKSTTLNQTCKLVPALALLAVFATACDFERLWYTIECEPAERLNDDPSRFLGQHLCVEGEVSERVDIPFTGHDYFKLTRNGGAIWIKGSSPPSSGTSIVSWGTLTRGADCHAPLVNYVLCEDTRRTF